jgi:hypothetical protein
MDGVWRGLEWFFENLPQSLLVVVFVVYVLSWLVWPQRKCPRCNASGARFGPMTLARKCGRCKGSGLIKRII